MHRQQCHWVTVDFLISCWYERVNLTRNIHKVDRRSYYLPLSDHYIIPEECNCRISQFHRRKQSSSSSPIAHFLCIEIRQVPSTAWTQLAVMAYMCESGWHPPKTLHCSHHRRNRDYKTTGSSPNRHSHHKTSQPSIMNTYTVVSGGSPLDYASVSVQ